MTLYPNDKACDGCGKFAPGGQCKACFDAEARAAFDKADWNLLARGATLVSDDALRRAVAAERPETASAWLRFSIRATFLSDAADRLVEAERIARSLPELPEMRA